MTPKQLKIAGAFAMASAFLTLPMTYYAFVLEGRSDPAADQILIFMQTAGTLIFVTITLAFKRLLNLCCNSHDHDNNLVMLVVAGTASGICAIGMFLFPAVKEPLSTVVMATLVLQGLVQVRFALALRHLADDLGGLLKPFCYANLATGILLASVILIPLSIPASALSDLMLGTIFFNTAKRRSVTDVE